MHKIKNKLKKYKLNQTDKIILAIITVLMVLSVLIDLKEIRVSFSLSAWSLTILFILQLVEEKNKRQEQEEIIKKELINASRNLATSQSESHWLANIVEAIIPILYKNPDEVEPILIRVCRYLRVNAMTYAGVQTLPIEQEIENTKNYLIIERLLETKVDVKYQLEDGGYQIPIYTIQPLIDNAIKHGIKGNKNINGEIIIKTYEENKYHVIEIHDNGVGYDTKQEFESSHIGLNNVRYRLENLCNGTLTMISNINKGTTARILIPKGA